MRVVFYYVMYARKDVIIDSNCLWLENVNSIPMRRSCAYEISKVHLQLLLKARRTKIDKDFPFNLLLACEQAGLLMRWLQSPLTRK